MKFADDFADILGSRVDQNAAIAQRGGSQNTRDLRQRVGKGLDFFK